MASDEFLRRIDEHLAHGNEHMARGNEHMARGNELMARGNELMAEVREEMRLNRAAYAEGARVTARLTQVLVRVDQSQRDLQDEIRAQRDAIFRMLDRFENGGAGPAPA